MTTRPTGSLEPSGRKRTGGGGGEGGEGAPAKRAPVKRAPVKRAAGSATSDRSQARGAVSGNASATVTGKGKATAVAPRKPRTVAVEVPAVEVPVVAGVEVVEAGADGRDERSILPVAAGAGAMTMVALCFANGLQGGMSQTFAQVIDQVKHTYHVNDATMGVVPFGVSVVGNLGALPVAALCARHRRTAVLAGMFVIWGVLVALAGLAPAFSVFGVASAGFALFALFKIASSALEATDPAALPLISDWWPAEQRAQKVSIFNTLSAVWTFGGLIIAGVMVDTVGWRPTFVIWLPIALIGSALIYSQREPERGVQDAAFSNRLEEEAEGADRQVVIELVERQAPEVTAVVETEVGEGLWTVVRAILRIPSWRMAAIGVSVTGLMGNGIMNWGISYFKRTFGLSGAQAGALAPVLGVGAFAGVLGGGFLADRLLRRGMLHARVYVTAAGFAGGGLVYMLAFTTTTLWLAALLLAVGSAFAALALGPQFALLMDVTPAPLRSQASAALNVLQATGALGPLLVGILSTAFGENLRLALLCMSPFYLVGAAIVFAARRTFVADVATVVAEAKSRVGRDQPTG